MEAVKHISSEEHVDGSNVKHWSATEISVALNHSKPQGTLLREYFYRKINKTQQNKSKRS